MALPDPPAFDPQFPLPESYGMIAHQRYFILSQEWREIIFDLHYLRVALQRQPGSRIDQIVNQGYAATLRGLIDYILGEEFFEIAKKHGDALQVLAKYSQQVQETQADIRAKAEIIRNAYAAEPTVRAANKLGYLESRVNHIESYLASL